MSRSNTFEVVRPYDPEVVAHAGQEAVAEYFFHRDLERLGLPDIARPVIFRCEVLSLSQCRIVEDLGNDSRKREMAFHYGIREIKNLPLGGGKFRDVPIPKTPAGVAADETLTNLGIGRRDVYDVGEVVLSRSFLGLGEELSCRPLDSSRHAYGVAHALHAERSKASTDADEPSK